MATFEFSPANRAQGRRTYRGALKELQAATIPLVFSPSALRDPVESARSGGATYTHQAVAHWCANAVTAYRRSDPLPTTPDLARAIKVAEDIDAQWDLQLANWPGGPQALNGVDADSIQLSGILWQKWSDALA